ncbi:hypothetical protein B0T16DRAFT_388527 [Cercophora newfieldiana]|uniref:Uncharacterized protein n=1 Tax=Cercophora newfieldiana TaxID=92897 RepID=A0AA40CT88_9PEZI|nr:hypothetical protein B0T16DRAFT_388527 [Cercophora newfieldiana]
MAFTGMSDDDLRSFLRQVARDDEVVNPHPDYGYIHGPIPKKEGSNLCAYNTLVCDVITGGVDDEMCGKARSKWHMRRHINHVHAGAVAAKQKRHKGSLKDGELPFARKAIVLFVLSGGWRDAKYLHEPIVAAETHDIKRIADTAEDLARGDEEFAESWGTVFNRASVGRGDKGKEKAHAVVQPPEVPAESRCPSLPSGEAGPSRRRATGTADTSLRRSTSDDGPVAKRPRRDGNGNNQVSQSDGNDDEDRPSNVALAKKLRDEAIVDVEEAMGEFARRVVVDKAIFDMLAKCLSVISEVAVQLERP